LIKLDFPALGRPTTAKRANQIFFNNWFLESIIKASNKSPVPLPEILAKV
jgi:hypothetical protein